MRLAPLYLLDTNITSYVMRSDKPALTAHMKNTHPSSFAISAITEAELRFGCYRRPAARQLAASLKVFLQRIAILPWDSVAADAYAHLRVELESAGTPLSAIDTMIAAHAIAIGATLISHDKAFTRIKGLKVADWTKA
jgi:tRNA(fMet)-specific endonuclease VapC